MQRFKKKSKFRKCFNLVLTLYATELQESILSGYIRRQIMSCFEAPYLVISLTKNEMINVQSAVVYEGNVILGTMS